MRRAAELLLVEAEALRPVLAGATVEAFGRPTVCTGWSVRDVIAHCSAALAMCATNQFHDFTPEDNQRDVDARTDWPLARLLDELFTGYEQAAVAIDAAAGTLDGIGLGEWVHGGDIREPLGAADAYCSTGSDLAVTLLIERSHRLGRKPLLVRVDGELHQFGSDDEPSARLVTDTETFVRLTGGRNPHPGRYQIGGDYDLGDLVLFG